MTSCEHLNQRDIDSIISKINEHTLIVLQSNNYQKINEHINCVDTKEVCISISIKLRNMKIYEKDFIKYKRFMIIGIKK